MFKKQILLIHTVHVLDRYNKTLYEVSKYFLFHKIKKSYMKTIRSTLFNYAPLVLLTSCTFPIFSSTIPNAHFLYRGADKSLARPTALCILFDGENFSFDASLVIYINSTNIPPIMIINRIYETQNLLSL